VNKTLTNTKKKKFGLKIRIWGKKKDIPVRRKVKFRGKKRGKKNQKH